MIQVVLILFAIVNAATFLYALHKVKNKKEAYGRVPQLLVITGSFVWADHVIFGAFWTLATIAAIALNDQILFALIYSVFWLVRSVGESMYWFLQQFSHMNRNPPENFRIHKVFHNSSVWFVHQIYWQVVTVTTILTSLLLASIWIKSI